MNSFFEDTKILKNEKNCNKRRKKPNKQTCDQKKKTEINTRL